MKTLHVHQGDKIFYITKYKNIKKATIIHVFPDLYSRPVAIVKHYKRILLIDYFTGIRIATIRNENSMKGYYKRILRIQNKIDGFDFLRSPHFNAPIFVKIYQETLIHLKTNFKHPMKYMKPYKTYAIIFAMEEFFGIKLLDRFQTKFLKPKKESNQNGQEAII